MGFIMRRIGGWNKEKRGNMKIVKWDKYDSEKYSGFVNGKEEAGAERIVIEEIKKMAIYFMAIITNKENAVVLFLTTGSSL